MHHPSWGDCSPACSPHCSPSLPGLPPGTAHCHTAAALPDSVLPLRGKGLRGGGGVWTDWRDHSRHI